MGPRSDERGNAAQSASRLKNVTALQWGRAPMSAEIVDNKQRDAQGELVLQWGRAPMSAEISA